MRAARSRYAEKEQQRRAALTPLERAREDLEKLLRRLSVTERKQLLDWASDRPDGFWTE